jgi:hypothetical protein
MAKVTKAIKQALFNRVVAFYFEQVIQIHPEILEALLFLLRMRHDRTMNADLFSQPVDDFGALLWRPWKQVLP